MLPIKKESRQPAYLQLYESLKKNILDGIYPSGARLPSKRVLADEAGVSVITAQHALDLLCQANGAPSRRGSAEGLRRGAERFTEMSRFFVEPQQVGLNTITIEDAGDLRHMRKVLADYDVRILEKAPNGGCPELREALAAYLIRSRQISVKPEQIIIGAGSEYLYGLIVTLLGRERVYAAEDPSYEKIALVYQANGVQLELLPMNSGGIESTALDATAASVLHVTPYRSFPSGVTADARKRHEYLAWASRPDRVLIEDDYSSEFSVSGKPEDTLFAMSGAGNVIYVNTFSLTIAPALRAGYMLLPEQLLEKYTARAGFYACAVPVFEQLVLASLLNSGDFERHIRRVRRRLRSELEGSGQE